MTCPDPKGDYTTPDGVVIPAGEGTNSDIGHSSLLYNEYPFTATASNVKIERLCKPLEISIVNNAVLQKRCILDAFSILVEFHQTIPYYPLFSAKKADNKIMSANFRKTFNLNCIMLKNQRQEGKHCRAR